MKIKFVIELSFVYLIDFENILNSHNAPPKLNQSVHESGLIDFCFHFVAFVN